MIPLAARDLIARVCLRLRMKAVARLRHMPFYPALYASWWHSFLRKKVVPSPPQAYLAACPHPGAGIGHQMANWIAGLWFAGKFGLEHAHVPFPSREWERLLGFGEQAVSMDSLLSGGEYKRVRLPVFDEGDAAGVDRTRRIMASYAGRKIVFLLEQDQFYRDQFGVKEELQRRFHASEARRHDRLKYREDEFNIAVHVRRGDIVQGQRSGNDNLTMRWQAADYFHGVLANVLASIEAGRIVRIYLFSQGDRREFSHFESLGNVEYCLDMDAHESFLHMVHADLLITSKSSFSYKPALLSQGIKVCPRNFWHGYPDAADWVLAEEDGSLSASSASQLLAVMRSKVVPV